MLTNKEWFSLAKIGLFTHYTYGTYPPEITNYGSTCKSARNLTIADNLDQLAEAFDAKKYARVADSMCTQYVTFTVAHAGNNFLFPSKTMIDAGLPQKASRRDLIRDLLEALAPYGIKLVLYYPPNDTHSLTKEEKQILGWENIDILTDFNCRLVREICERYDNKIDGFWFDQSGPEQIVCDTIRQINKDAVIFCNYGITANGTYFNPAREDFWTSEYYGPLTSTPSDTWPTHFSQISKIIGGEWWARGLPVTKTAARELYRWTVRVAATDGQRNGGVHWAAGPYMDNEWEDGVEKLMAEFGALIRKNKESIIDTLPSIAFPTPSKSILPQEYWGVATQSLDGSKTYIHVLNAPQSNTLTLGKPSIQGDNWNFTRAEIMGQKASLEKSESDWMVTLPAGINWDPDDTIITMQ